MPDVFPEDQEYPSRPSSSTGSDDASFDEIVLRPPPSALTHTLTHYDPAASSSLQDYTPRPSSQRSLTDTFFDKCSPLVQKATSALQQQTSKVTLHSPKKSFAGFISPAVRNSSYGLSSPTKAKGAKALGDWFSGASAPVNIGLVPSQQRNFDPTDDEAEEEEEMFTQWRGGREQQRQTSSSPGKFSWILGGGSAAAKDTTPKAAKSVENSEDELLRLNVESALFPHGPADPLNPTSFNDLLAAAESVIHRYQEAYRQQHFLIADLQAEQDAQDDELDEAETRARHLKLQLDDMAAKATEQNREMQRLRSELDAERRLRRQEEEARLKSVQLVRGPQSLHGRNDSCVSSPTMETKEQKHAKRLSGTHSIDSGFESGEESCTASVRSKDSSRSMESSETLTPSVMGGERPTMRLEHRQSTYDKTLHSRLSMMAKEDLSGLGPWQVVSTMREENAHLRVRVRELESAVDDALSMMVGLGASY